MPRAALAVLLAAATLAGPASAAKADFGFGWLPDAPAAHFGHRPGRLAPFDEDIFIDMARRHAERRDYWDHDYYQPMPPCVAPLWPYGRGHRGLRPETRDLLEELFKQ